MRCELGASEIQSEFLDLGAAGPSLGDEIVFSERLFRRGREVGTSGGVCTATGVVAPYDVLTFNCVVTLSLRSGQITLQGLIEIQGEDDPGPFLLAITGGTGKFRGAGGEARFRELTPERSVYKLRFDSRGKQHGKHHRQATGRKGGRLGPLAARAAGAGVAPSGSCRAVGGHVGRPGRPSRRCRRPRRRCA